MRSNTQERVFSAASQETLALAQYEVAEERGRETLRSSQQKFVDPYRSPNAQRSPRQRSTSKSQQSYFPDDPYAPPVPASQSPRTPKHASQQINQCSSSRPDSWAGKRGMYVCRVIHGCKPPTAVSYFSYPFFTLTEGEIYEVMQECGHPSMHPKLPLYVDDGEDCLLLCRDTHQNVGWALASFLEPLHLQRY